MTDAAPQEALERPMAGAEPPAAAREALFVLAAVLVGAALGLLVGVVWWAFAPHPLVRVAADHSVSPADAGSKVYVAADGYFLVITAAVGLVCGALVAWRARRYAVGAPVGLTLGGVAGGLVAWWLGSTIGAGAAAHRVHTAAVGTTLHDHVRLGAKGALLTWALAAVLVYLVAVAWRFAASPRTVPHAGEPPEPPPPDSPVAPPPAEPAG